MTGTWKVRFSVAMLLVFGQCNTALADEAQENDPFEDATDLQPSSAEMSDGILPQLGILLKFPDNLQLRNPRNSQTTTEPVIYERKLPLFGQQAVDRGYALPLPFGISIIGVDNSQLQEITDPAVALGKGFAPPPGTPLVPIPFVTLENVISRTSSKQVKLDVWVLPNVNLFGSVGKVNGSADLDVVVDLDQIFPPPICTPISPCGTATGHFVAGIDATTITIGATVVHGWDNYFLTGTGSLTETIGKNSDTSVSSVSASARFGRRWLVGHNTVFAPYIGVSYLDYDEEIEGVTGLPNAFPDGDSLEVRYRAQSTNVDKFSGVIGLNVGFKNGMGIQAEYNKSQSGERFVLSGVTRF